MGVATPSATTRDLLPKLLVALKLIFYLTNEMKNSGAPERDPEMISIKFEDLPDEAFLKVAFVSELTSKGESTIYLASQKGHFPKIRKIGRGSASGIRVGDLRQYLKDPENYTQENNSITATAKP